MKLATLLSSLLLNHAAANVFDVLDNTNYTGEGKIYVIERCKPENIHGCLDSIGHVVGSKASCATFNVTTTHVSSTAGVCQYIPIVGGEEYISISCSHESNRFMAQADLDDVRMLHKLRDPVTKMRRIWART
jgi:hypothetical protein